jgi:UDP-glucose 4-epimerase
MNILVTGGRGFIGQKLILKLISLNYNVISIDRSYKSNTEIVGCTYIIEDIKNISNINLHNIDVCYHLASVHLDKSSSFENPQETFDNIIVGTQRVAMWCLENNIKIIYTGSSSSFYSKTQSPYTISKSISEDILRSYQKLYNLDLDIATIYNVYGNYHNTSLESSKLLNTWKNQIDSKTITMFGDGTQIKNFIHVDDVVSGLLILCNSKSSYTNWHIGYDTSYSLNYIYNVFKEMISDLNLEKIEIKNVDNSNHKLINRDFFDTFNWSPTISIYNYIKETLLILNK